MKPAAISTNGSEPDVPPSRGDRLWDDLRREVKRAASERAAQVLDLRLKALQPSATDEDKRAAIAAHVDQTLRQDPKYSFQRLFEEATAIDAGLLDRGVNYFNGTFCLPVRRKMADERRTKDRARGIAPAAQKHVMLHFPERIPMSKPEGAVPRKADKVMDMVRDAIQANPSVGTDELFEKAKKLDKSMGDLTVRQFHARYPLQVKRYLAAQNPKKKKYPRRKKVDEQTNGRPLDTLKIRNLLLAFAEDVTKAEERHQLVQVIGKVDEYVDRVAAIAKPA